VNGPRTDVSDITTYTYYGSDGANNKAGDLESITNALGHVTQFTHYDGAGRLTRMVDPNGLATVLEYWPRGWLKSRRLLKTGEVDETTQYEYDYLGKLCHPARRLVGSLCRDDAQRLNGTMTTRQLIDYILDAKGNEKEKT
jgi:YD repeat-containing protein